MGVYICVSVIWGYIYVCLSYGGIYMCVCHMGVYICVSVIWGYIYVCLSYGGMSVIWDCIRLCHVGHLWLSQVPRVCVEYLQLAVCAPISQLKSLCQVVSESLQAGVTCESC